VTRLFCDVVDDFVRLLPLLFHVTEPTRCRCREPFTFCWIPCSHYYVLPFSLLRVPRSWFVTFVRLLRLRSGWFGSAVTLFVVGSLVRLVVGCYVVRCSVHGTLRCLVSTLPFCRFLLPLRCACYLYVYLGSLYGYVAFTFTPPHVAGCWLRSRVFFVVLPLPVVAIALRFHYRWFVAVLCVAGTCSYYVLVDCRYLLHVSWMYAFALLIRSLSWLLHVGWFFQRWTFVVRSRFVGYCSVTACLPVCRWLPLDRCCWLVLDLLLVLRDLLRLVRLVAVGCYLCLRSLFPRYVALRWCVYTFTFYITLLFVGALPFTRC